MDTDYRWPDLTHEMTIVLPGKLMVSGCEPPKDLEFLRHHQIKNIVRLGDNDDFACHYVTHDTINYVNELINDDLDADFTIDFLNKLTSHIHQCDGPVLVHCFMGISRSCTVVIAYVMRYNRLSLRNAIEYLSDKRVCSSPNSKFLRDLKVYETHLSYA